MELFEWPIEVALAKAVEESPSGQGWSMEPEYDDYRCVAETAARRLASRQGKDLSAPFSDLAGALGSVPAAVLDGELLAVEPDGTLAFTKPQSRAGGRRPKHGNDVPTPTSAFA